jgi:hypothetical protein
LREKLIVLAQTTTKSEPSKRSFDDPSTRKNPAESRVLRREAMPFKMQMGEIVEVSNGNPLSTRFGRMLNDFHAPFEEFFYPLLSRPGISLIYPNVRNTWKLFVHPF